MSIQDTDNDTITYKEIFNNTLSQQVITSTKDNHPIGNIMDNSNKPNNTICIYLKNINGIKCYNKWNNLKTACSELKKMNVDIFGITETNLNWNTKSRMEARQIIQQKDNYFSAQLATSSNKQPTLTHYQPGGTDTAITNKWTGRITKQINDTSGMGRWSGFKMQTNNSNHLNVITA
jgi:hypothetical protein